MLRADIMDHDDSEIDTILAKDIDFDGVLKFKKSLKIEGKLKGEIKATGHLILGKDSVVNATISADKVTNYGKINGNIEAKSGIELSSTSELVGAITTPEIVIQRGCKFDGQCNMTGNKKNNENK